MSVLIRLISGCAAAVAGLLAAAALYTEHHRAADQS
jgi:hypothetical protein